jgi:DNA-binding GntR family transcriptional regulator
MQGTLDTFGVVEILPFRGARVRRPSAPELLEAYVVRSELEALGARLASVLSGLWALAGGAFSH